jgi:hypothetical protein
MGGKATDAVHTITSGITRKTINGINGLFAIFVVTFGYGAYEAMPV